MFLSPLLVFAVINFVWAVIISIFFFRLYFYYLRLTKNGKKELLTKSLDEIFRRESSNYQEIEKLKMDVAKIAKEGEFHIQKLGLFRFNPFKDTGGDQSFVLSLLDANNTGVVISSLHTRTGTRWYAKKVLKGKGAEYELSSEEEKALKESTFLLDSKR